MKGEKYMSIEINLKECEYEAFKNEYMIICDGNENIKDCIKYIKYKVLGNCNIDCRVNIVDEEGCKLWGYYLD